MFEHDPFEDFKRQRQVELMERKFRHKARTRSRELHELVRTGKPENGLADRIHQEMQEFFSDSQQHVSRLINQAEHPQGHSIEKQVHAEMADFFRESTEAAQLLLTELCEANDQDEELADKMVQHLNDVFEKSMEHIAQVKEQHYKTPPKPPGQQDDASTAAAPAPAAPEAVTKSPPGTANLRAIPAPRPAAPIRRPERVGRTEAAPAAQPPERDQDVGSPRILKRQSHLPVSAAARKRALGQQAATELRALKELLVEKGLITAEELADKVRTLQGS